ncbi:hypothetical protein [Adlercreutzia sp. ZJ141]|uniref:hypothetical protein n=1 Tax=Adlercreutzia sp. ZJ141 TaxID=2709406 RepID=UPI0013EBF12E|nr:hypothetical protein [Adlercreutzia sp. ZJ141]
MGFVVKEYHRQTGKVRTWAALRKERCLMGVIHEALNVLAMVSTVALFILEIWRTWKEHKREDDEGNKE